MSCSTQRYTYSTSHQDHCVRIHLEQTNNHLQHANWPFNELSCLLLSVIGVPIFKLVAIISAPVAIVKTLISVIHGIVASVNITTLDAKEREAAKKIEGGKKSE